MGSDRQLSSNMEDYLEAIAILKKQKGVARVKDIGIRLNVKKPSVNAALEGLSTAGVVAHERYGFADLTEKGEIVARDVMARHHTLIRFLTKILGIDDETAEIDACRMEHSMSREGFERLSKFMDFVDSCPEIERPEWLVNFYRYLKTGKRQKCSARKRGTEG